ncbi:hypothetical protein QQ008_19860 [Fulvivirgaceae bacterium BMA10]|uniref:Outer membrane protein beta-barrel domain-containing protein n=1 Tax=Splendidivirga corallicola TaxID=3051826 RepID=A0ABT8KW27_9BACT|nr:hypothetical protein [Fulvivirgaceae bacterium BMA10]
MKKIIIFLQIFVCIQLLPVQGWTQSDNSSQHAIIFNTSYTDATNGLILNPGYMFERTKSNITVGPTLLVPIGDNLDGRDGLKLSGIQGSYQLFPFKNENKLQLYFQGDLILQRIKDEVDANFFNVETGSFEPFTFERTDNVIQVYFGYGLKLDLGEKMFLLQSIGLGSSINKRKTNLGFADFSDNFIDFDWLVKVGIGRKF